MQIDNDAILALSLTYPIDWAREPHKNPIKKLYYTLQVFTLSSSSSVVGCVPSMSSSKLRWHSVVPPTLWLTDMMMTRCRPLTYHPHRHSRSRWMQLIIDSPPPVIPFPVNDGRRTTIPQYRSLSGAFVTIFRQEGVRGLYKGVTPNVWGSGSAWGLYFMLWVQG